MRCSTQWPRLRLACGDNALAHDSKTQMRIRAYKAAYQNPGSSAVLGLVTTPGVGAIQPHSGHLIHANDSATLLP